MIVCLLAVIALTCVIPTSAQVVSLYDVQYRPPGERWMIVKDGPFEIIYPDRHEQQARETLWTLRTTAARTNAFLGLRHDYSLTAVLSDQSDSGNGYVTPFPFKTEINAIALRGRALSREHTSWTEVVTAHELVHAAQGAFRINRSATGIAGRISPDFARALSLFQPSGMVEGLAVYRESEIPDGAGRLNHPYFMAQARAGMIERGGWSLSQALEEPSYTRPFNRFYLGGALFVDYLVDTFGESAVHESMKWQQHIPLSGFGSNLRLAVDQSPSKLESSFRDWFWNREDSIRQAIGTLYPSTKLVSRLGQTHRRPFWLGDNTIVTYALGYNLPRGFHRVTDDGSMRRLTWNEITDDAVLFVPPRSGEAFYSRYSENPLAPEARTSWSYRVDLNTGEEERIEGAGHTYNPVILSDDRILAIRSFGQFNRIVELTTGEQEERLRHPSLEIVSMAPRPGSDSLAVIAKVGTHQGVYLVDTSAEQWQLSPWIGFESSTIYDGSWNETGRYFAFTSDRTGIMNVYVLDAWTEQIIQATNALYGAMEGHVSSDGQSLAFVEYGEEQFDLRTADLTGDWVETVNRDQANHTWNLPWQVRMNEVRPFSALDSSFADAKPYRSWKRMAPRMIYPTAYLDNPRERPDDARLGLGIGVAMQGTDPLQRMAWYGEGVVQKNRLWGELGVQSARWAFRPGVNVERRPTTVDAIVPGRNELQRVIRDRISWTVSTRLPYTIEQNVHRTSVVPALAFSFRSDRFLDDGLTVLQDRRSRLSMLPSLFFGRKLQRNSRDLWPSRGQSVSWFADIELNRDVGEMNRGSITFANAYFPWLRRSNTSIRLDAGHLYQNRPGIFGLAFFRPTGWDDARVGDDHWARYGLRIMQPVAFPDNGWLTIPGYIRAVYLRAGAESLVNLASTNERYSSVSVGAGIKFRIWHFFDMDISWQAAYRLQTKDWDTVWTTVSEN